MYVNLAKFHHFFPLSLPCTNLLKFIIKNPEHFAYNVSHSSPKGDHSLLNFAYTCVRDLFIGGVNMFHYFRIPYFTCNFFTKFTYNEYIGPYFLLHVVLRFLPSDLPELFSCTFIHTNPIGWVSPIHKQVRLRIHWSYGWVKIRFIILILSHSKGRGHYMLHSYAN